MGKMPNKEATAPSDLQGGASWRWLDEQVEAGWQTERESIYELVERPGSTEQGVGRADLWIWKSSLH
jgi:hypothetical protein